MSNSPGAASERVSRFEMSTGLVAAEYVVADYDYKTASTSNATSIAQTHRATGVRYAFADRYPGASHGARAAALQLAAQQMDQQTGHAASACFALTAGSEVSLAGHANAGFNVSYVVRKVEHRATNDQYDNEFDVFPAQVAFRAPRVSARPVVAGTHTAVVTGSSGEEIWTDSLGRIKVKFHWDRDAIHFFDDFADGDDRTRLRAVAVRAVVSAGLRDWRALCRAGFVAGAGNAVERSCVTGGLRCAQRARWRARASCRRSDPSTY